MQERTSNITEKPTVKRVYVTLRDPVTGKSANFTVYGLGVAEVARLLGHKAK